jgi:hypothetical protein
MTQKEAGIFGNQRRLALVALALVILAAAAWVLNVEFTRPASFSLQVFPEAFKSPVIPGQKCVYLVYVTNDTEGRGHGNPVDLSATAAGCMVTITNQSLAPGVVAEITVTPGEATVNGTVSVVIQAEREGLVRTKSVSLDITNETDQLGEDAALTLDKFIPWLAANHPELGITSQTEWAGTIVSPRWLVVSHYLFFSDEWELHIEWHIMIAPYDWARIDLRRRFSESSPSIAFEISSVSGETAPIPIAPPESPWR